MADLFSSLLETLGDAVGALRETLGPDAWIVPAIAVLLLVALLIPARRARSDGMWVRLWATGAVAAGVCVVVLLPR